MNNEAIRVLSDNKNIVLRIREGVDLNDIKKELKAKLPELKQFYKEAKNPIRVTGKMLKKDEIDKIQKIITKTINVKVIFDSPKTLGLHGIKRNYSLNIETSETKFIKGSIRSGQKVEFEGSIVIIGDVNSGAEVIAEDNIVVQGCLRGMAHAGAKGNRNAIISAQVIDSSQIRIASIIKERNRKEIETQVYSYAFVNLNEEIELSN